MHMVNYYYFNFAMLYNTLSLIICPIYNEVILVPISNQFNYILLLTVISSLPHFLNAHRSIYCEALTTLI